MRTTAPQTRDDRTITVDFQHDATDVPRLGDGKALVAWGLAFELSLGWQLPHQTTCGGGGCLPRHSHDVRVRLGGVTSGRRQCPMCRAVFTIVPPVILRDRQLRPEVTREALPAPHGGLRLEWCALRSPLSPMARSRLICALGPQPLVSVLTRCGLPCPTAVLADEQHRCGLTDTVSLPTMVIGRVLGPLGETTQASAAALTQSYEVCPRAAGAQEPTDRGRGMLTDGIDSPHQGSAQSAGTCSFPVHEQVGEGAEARWGQV